MYSRSVLCLALMAVCISSGLSSPKFKRSAGIKSAEKCKEYAEHFGSPKWEECSFKKKELVDTVWTKVDGNQFPHMVSLGYEKEGEKKYVCVGSIISERYILAPGHCIIPTKTIKIEFIKVHATNEEIKVAEPIRHPDYQAKSHINSIGLLKLEKDITFSKDARPVCLNADNVISQDKFLAAGYGFRKIVDKDQLFSNVLHVLDNAECTKFYEAGKLTLNYEQHLCAYANDVKEQCGGDPFSVIQNYNDDVPCTYKLIALNSFGVSCPKTKNPDVFTKVAPFIEWIENIVWP